MSETEPQPPENPRSLEIDLDAYLPLFEDESISEEDKRALLKVLWSMVISFVQIGWGLHPVQQAQASRAARESACGKLACVLADCGTPPEFVVELQDQFLIGQFDSAADIAPQNAGES